MFAWQGWTISLPSGWNPMKLEGDFDAGYALIADLDRPRLGMRWTTPQKLDASALAKKAIVEEVGQLGADEARPCTTENWKGAMLFTESEPPGRDVWAAQSKVSGRSMELVHHVHAGEASQMPQLLSKLIDSQPQAELPWSVFDLSCRSPHEWRLEKKMLNAGDLRLTFAKDSQRRTIRQIAVAHLALKQTPLDKWLDQQQLPYEKNYRAAGSSQELILSPSGLKGFARRLERRGGLWRRRLPAQIHILVFHDPNRDKLLLLEAESQASAEELARTVGWADKCFR
jgi:hypothetical protein